jgi:carbon starvation protein
VIAVWVSRRRRNPISVLIPGAFLLVMTVWALIVQLDEFWSADERWVLVPLDLVILVLALWLLVEAGLRMRRVIAEGGPGVLVGRGSPTTDAEVEAERTTESQQ